MFQAVRNPHARGLLAALAVAAGLLAQAPPSRTFEDLSQSAAAVIDSNPAEAAKLLTEALRLRPDWAEGWFYAGGALYQVDRYAEATDAFRKGLALNPNQGTAWAFLGLCEAELDNPDQALADIRKGLQIGIGDNAQFETAVRVKAARLLIRASSFDEAFAEILPLARRGIDAPAVIDALGLSALGASVNSLSELSPQRRAVVQLAGKASWSSVNQKPAEAAAAYRELLERYPKEPGVHYAQGLYLLETDLTAALAAFQEEVRIDPRHWPAWIVLGSLHIRQGAADDAIAALRNAMKIMPTKYRWLCHAEIGRAHMTADRTDAAIRELQTAVKLMPSIAQLHFFLSQAYRSAGRMEEAMKATVEFQKLKVQQDPLGVPSLRSLYVKP